MSLFETSVPLDSEHRKMKGHEVLETYTRLPCILCVQRFLAPPLSHQNEFIIFSMVLVIELISKRDTHHVRQN